MKGGNREWTRIDANGLQKGSEVGMASAAPSQPAFSGLNQRAQQRGNQSAHRAAERGADERALSAPSLPQARRVQMRAGTGGRNAIEELPELPVAIDKDDSTVRL